jgi:site-specific DNA recombinase
VDEIESELAALQSNKIDDAEITAALADFNDVWDEPSPKEQSRLVSLLIERVEYDGREGDVSITLHPTGIHAPRIESGPDPVKEIDVRRIAQVVDWRE